MKLPDIHDFSTTALYQQATQILHSSQTFSIEEEAPNEFAALFQTEKELLQIRLQLDDASGYWAIYLSFHFSIAYPSCLFQFISCPFKEGRSQFLIEWEKRFIDHLFERI